MFLILRHQIKLPMDIWCVKWARHSQTEFLPADIVISLAIYHQDGKKRTNGEKREIHGSKETTGSNCSGKPENDEINSKPK
jgi:hypothetical protein